MADKATMLFREGKINKFEYDTYILFEGSDLGRAYLSNVLFSVVMEEPINGRGTDYAKADGRRSCWREIKNVISHVDKLIEDYGNVTNRNANAERNVANQFGVEPIRTFTHPDFG